MPTLPPQLDETLGRVYYIDPADSPNVFFNGDYKSHTELCNHINMLLGLYPNTISICVAYYSTFISPHPPHQLIYTDIVEYVEFSTNFFKS